MTDPSLVTVIIPTYKRAHLVSRAIESVRRQTYRNIEIIVVDDGSPDDTRAVVNSIPDRKIRYVRHATNKGLPAARNTGIRTATGEYIGFIDDDDEWRADKLEQQLRAVKKYDAVLCMGVANGYPLRVHKRPNITLEDLKRGSFNPSGLLARSSVLKDVMFDESLGQGEDWDAFIRIAQQYSIGWIAEPLLIYNEGGHERMTNEKKYLSGPELEKRTAMLYKHRKLLGEKWFKYHLADALLAYVGSRPDKLSCLVYAVKRCGFMSVTATLAHRMGRRLNRVMRPGMQEYGLSTYRSSA